MASLLAVFPAESLGATMGLWQSSGPFAQVVGFASGGWIVELSGWRMTFWITLALGLVAVLLVRSWIPESVRSRSSLGFDWLGTLVLALGLGLVLLAITSLAQENASLGRTLSLFGLGVAMLGGFLVLETKLIPETKRLLNLRLLADGDFTLASLIAGLRMFFVGGSYFLLPLLLEEVRCLGPVVVGVILGLSPLMVGVGALIGGRTTDVYGSRSPNTIGMAAMTVAFLLLSWFAVAGSLPYLILAVLLQGFGSGLTLVPLHRLASSRFGEEEAGVGFGTYNAIRFLGSASSPAVTGAMLDVALSRAALDSSGQASAYAVVFLLLTALAALATALGFLLKN